VVVGISAVGSVWSKRGLLWDRPYATHSGESDGDKLFSTCFAKKESIVSKDTLDRNWYMS
jgi:hypothetical protein